MTNCTTGDCSEARFIAEVVERGFRVYVPIGHSHAADIIIHLPPYHPVGVQVKTATYYPDRDDYGVKCARDGGLYTEGDFQVLAAWLGDRKQFVLWRFDEICERKKISYTPRLHRQPDNWEILDTVLK
jgi:hypothetical protein